jgi:hypothetical protein
LLICRLETGKQSGGPRSAAFCCPLERMHRDQISRYVRMKDPGEEVRATSNVLVELGSVHKVIDV